MSSHIRKYAVNYTRSFPEHRVFPGNKTEEQIRGKLFERLRFAKAGFANAMVHGFQLHLCLISCVGYAVASYYATDGFSRDISDLEKSKNNKTSLKWGVYSGDKTVGKFSNIHNRFQGEKGGIPDWA